MVLKPTRKWKYRSDYRRLNAQTILDRYSILLIHDFVHSLLGGRIFSILDLAKAISKTPICTPLKLIEFARMAFVLYNAEQTFPVLRKLNFGFIHIDDVLVASFSEYEHIAHLDCIFQRFIDDDLVLNFDKNKFLQRQVKFFGHNIPPDGIQPDLENLRAIASFPLPQTVKDLRTLVGMLNFYRLFRYLSARKPPG